MGVSVNGPGRLPGRDYGLVQASQFQLVGERELQVDSCRVADSTLVVCDGVGDSPVAGVVASNVAEWVATGLDQAGDSLVARLLELPRLLGVRLEAEGLAAATTLAVAHLASDGLVWLATVGDSRVVLLRQQAVLFASRPHNALEFDRLLRPGSRHNPSLSTLLKRAVGAGRAEPIDVSVQRVESGDRLVLFSDGLENALGLEAIIREMILAPRLDAALRQLGLAAQSLEPQDNCTCVAAQVEGVGSP